MTGGRAPHGAEAGRYSYRARSLQFRSAHRAPLAHACGMYAISRILLALKDPRARSRAALEKAAQLAHALGAELQLFHAIADPIYLDSTGVMAQAYPELEKERLDWYRERLEGLARGLRRRGIKVSTAVAWDFPACESIVRQAERFEASLIVVECHATAHRAPWLLRFTDWELLRRSPLPVLLIKSRHEYRRPRILAALDPTHVNAKPGDLDGEIVRYAATVAEGLHGPLHAMHAYQLPSRLEAPPAGSEDGRGRARSQRRGRPQAVRALLTANAAWTARAALQEALRWSGVPEGRQHVVALPPAAAIEAVAHDVGADIVAMGAVSRSGLRRLFIGNTAEKVLDRLACDVLVVKPRAFRNRVPREPRGVQLIALPE